MYEIERDGGKPEGVVAELADFVMMTLDLGVYLKGSFPGDDVETWNTNEDAVATITELKAYNLVGAFVAIMASMGKIANTAPMLYIIYAAYIWMKAQGFDLWDIIRQKMAYNESRPALHGRLY
jgi:hypothetical protein